MMGLGIFASAALAATLVAASPADRREKDLQCLVAVQEAASQADETTKAALENATMYYFGRVDAAIPQNELEDRLLATAKAIEGKPLGPILQECGNYMAERGKLWIDLGTRLQARGEARETNKASSR